MKKFLMSLLMLFPLVVFAQQKVGMVNMTEVMSELPDVKAADAKIQDLAKKYDADIKAMQDEYKTKSEAFVKEKDTLVEAVRNRRLQEIQDIEMRIQQSYQAMQEDLQKQQAQLLEPIRSKVLASVKKVADAEGCAYVLEQTSLLYTGASALDLTAKIKNDLGIKPSTAKATGK